MATITEIQLQDGSIHQLGGGGGGETYTLTKSGNTITLAGSGGDLSSVTDADTTYTFSLSGNTLTITPSGGTPQTITLPDDNTTYSISISGNVVTLTGSDGSTDSITIPNDNTTYTLSISGNTLTLTPSVGTPQSVTIPDEDTTYYISVDGDLLSLFGSDGSSSSVNIPDVHPNEIKYVSYKFDSWEDIHEWYRQGKYIVLHVEDTESEERHERFLQLVDFDDETQTFIFVAPDDNGVYYAILGSNTRDYSYVANTNTTYTISVSGHTLTLTPSSGDAQSITLPDDDTTYTISVSGNNLTLTPSSGTAQEITLPIPTKTSDLANDSGFITGMTLLSYGNSTWGDFITAYNANKVVYCRASSNSNPATGSQTRLAFMAYVNNAATPTEVEFQYYRSVSSHTISQQGDQVYVYKLNKTNGWSVTVRQASSKVVAGSGLASSYSNGTLTLTAPPDSTKQDLLVSGTNIKTINGNSILGSGDLQVGGSVISTDVPTADTIAEFDSDAHMNSEDMTSQEVDDFVDGLNVSGGGLLNMFYPVGSIYQTIDDGFNPNIRWGGTWELIEEGRFLQATETSATGGDTVSAGLPNIGGHLDIRATDYNASKVAWEDGVFIKSTTAGYSADAVHQQNGAVNVIRYNFDAHYYNSIYGNSTTVQPPAVKVYMWHRTA